MNKAEIAKQEVEAFTWMKKQGYDRRASKDIAPILVKYLTEQLTLTSVGCCCVDKETLIKELDDKRIVGTTLNYDMWRYCRKETAEHLLDKYNITLK